MSTATWRSHDPPSRCSLSRHVSRTGHVVRPVICHITWFVIWRHGICHITWFVTSRVLLYHVIYDSTWSVISRDPSYYVISDVMWCHITWSIILRHMWRHVICRSPSLMSTITLQTGHVVYWNRHVTDSCHVVDSSRHVIDLNPSIRHFFILNSARTIMIDSYWPVPSHCLLVLSPPHRHLFILAFIICDMV